jgi:outer membrane PBP1 activator LpoA protein
MAIATLLTACTPGFKTAPGPYDPLAGVSVQLQQLEAAGDYAGAAELYLGLSGTPEQQREWRLRAAETLLRGSDAQRALAIADALDPYLLDPDQRARLGLLRTRAALLEDDITKAIATLPMVSPALDQARLREVLDTRITVFARAGQTVDQILERLQLDRLVALEDPTRQDNRDALWRLLPSIPDEQLQTLPSVDRDLVGWIALLEVARIPIDETEAFDTALRSWQTRFAGHPASAQADLLGSARLNRSVPGAIALLIPESGRFAVAGRQVRAGFQAAYNRALQPRPRLRVYDTGVNEAISQMRRATAEGAALVVGPLTKEEVAAVSALPDRTVPLLALNRSNAVSASPAPQFEFGLAPEDEAAQIAMDALRSGARRALAMYPAGAWGERVYAAFFAAFEGGGGSVLDAAVYDAEQADFSAQIQSLFLMDAGQARRARLQSTIDRNLEFDPQRRNDADFLMLASQADPVRSLYPQLRFYRVADLPVLATSDVYAGSVDATRDRDLSGLRFLELPFLLELDDRERQAWIASAEAGDAGLSTDRLFALGADAFTLVPWFQALAASPGSEIEGLTGRLRIEGDGRVVRTMPWAEFRDGVPSALESTLLERR